MNVIIFTKHTIWLVFLTQFNNYATVFLLELTKKVAIVILFQDLSNMQDRSFITINNIIKAAQTLFVSRQYAEVSLKDIATEAGVTKGALYHHFSTKEDLYLNMMLHYLGELEGETRTKVENSKGRPCLDRVYDSLSGFLQLPEETIEVIRLVRRDSSIFQPTVRQQIIETYQAALPNLLETIFSEAMANGEIIQADARLLTWQYIALVEVSMHPYGRAALGDTQSLAKFIATNFVKGIETGERRKD